MWAAAAAFALAVAAPVAAEDRHDGYYYPPITSHEVYKARTPARPDATREIRIGFIVAETEGQAQRPYPPRFAMFAKGEHAEKLIIIGFDEGFQTLYRARAVLAQLTARARGTALLRNMGVEDMFTFLDVVRLLGFTQVTLSDGASWSHQIDLE